MYSEQLETLIKSVIADGNVTEKERAVLHKRAEAEGVDTDEIDIYIDGLLSPTPPSKNEDSYNIKLFNRIRAEGGIYDLYRKTYSFHVENNDEGIHLEIFYFTRYETKNKQLYFFVHTNKYSGHSWYGIKKLDFTIEEYGQVYLKKEYLLVPKDHDKLSNSYVIEPENLFLLCQASEIQTNWQFYYRDERIQQWEYVNIDVPLPISFITFLQRFYNEAIDPTAFPNIEEEEAKRKAAEVKRKEEEAKRKEEEAKRKAAEAERKEEEKKRKRKEKAATEKAERAAKLAEEKAERAAKLAEEKAEWESANICEKIKILKRRHPFTTLIIQFCVILFVLKLIGLFIGLF